MSAHVSPSPEQHFTSAQVELLTRSIRAARAKFQDSGVAFSPVSRAQRRAIRQIAAASKSLLVEPQLCLVSFKASLNRAADNARLAAGPERSDLLARFIYVFIEEFYRSAELEQEDGACRGKSPKRFTTVSEGTSAQAFR